MDGEKIEKVRFFDFQYDNLIKHKPLHVIINGLTEMYNIKNWDYSFLIKDKSLNKIKRKLND